MLLRKFFFWLSTKRTITNALARYGMRYGFARRFVAGETLDEAIAAATELGRAGRRVILNLLGESVRTPNEARQARDSYLEILGRLDSAGLDGNIAVKLTQLGLGFDPEMCLSLTDEIAAAAAKLHRTIEIDMEDSAYTTQTLAIYETTERRYGNAGVALQAYLRRSDADIEKLASLVENASGHSDEAPHAPICLPKVRLVKGAYLEPSSVAFQKKSEVDENYRRLLDRLLLPRSADGSPSFITAIGTHDPVLIDYARDNIVKNRLTRKHYEFQMIYGIRRDLQQHVFERGDPLRIYIPFGSAWCPYFMRRLAERPANVWFVLKSLFVERTPAK